MEKNRSGISRVLLFVLAIPLGLAHSAQAASGKEKLGELLYFDKQLSINKNQACASCHTPPHFVDPANTADPANSVVSAGSDASLHGGRNAPSAGYAAFTPPFSWNAVEAMYVGGQFWDGRASSLADQAKGPFLNPVEMAMPSKAAVLARIASEKNPNNNRYRELFNKVYGVDIEKYKASNKNPPAGRSGL